MVRETKRSFAPPFAPPSAPPRQMLLAALTVALICSPGLSSLARAADGRLDPTFGDGGKVTTDFANSFDNANAVAIQPDGKIVVVGFTAGGPANDADFAVARYNVDGSLDATFGTDGKVTTDFAHTGDAAHAVAIQSDGKIVVAGGTTLGPNNTPDFAVVRYNVDGSLDTSFGDGGKVHTEFGSDISPLPEQANAVAVQGDGKIVVVGQTYSSALGSEFALVRYNSDGSLDATFGTNGKVITDVSGQANAFAIASAVVIQSDGKIIAAGTATSPGSHDDMNFALARYNDDGSLDASFGTGGIVDVDFGSPRETGRAVALQPDGKIVVAGQTNLSGFDQFAVVRYNADGTPDGTFGDGGLATTNWGGSFYTRGYGVGIQADGKVVIAGNYTVPDRGISDFAVSRYNADGTLDTSYGTDGLTLTDFSGSFSSVAGMALQDDGKTVVVATVTGGAIGFADFALARYEGPQQ